MEEAKKFMPRYPNFKEDEAKRPDWDHATNFHLTKTLKPDWRFGQGSNGSDPGWETKKHLSIDPYEEGRSGLLNYKLLTTAIIPRPIAFISSRSKDGVLNLAPFSFFNYINHDPPLFVVGFMTNMSKPNGGTQDTLRNVAETGECVINIISESFIEAANSTSALTWPHTSEWDISGLTPVFDCRDVKPPRVKESMFSVEAKVDTLKEYKSRGTEGRVSGTLAVFEGTNFWAREDAINEEKSGLDPDILRAVSRAGGIEFSRSNQIFEIPIPDFAIDIGGDEGVERAKMEKGSRG